MRIGEMDTLVQIQSKTITRDSAGGVVESWADLRTAWVQRRQLSGAESTQDGRETPSQSVEFWGHFVDWVGIGTAHRITLDGLIHDITRVDLNRAKGSALIGCTAGRQ